MNIKSLRDKKPHEAYFRQVKKPTSEKMPKNRKTHTLLCIQEFTVERSPMNVGTAGRLLEYASNLLSIREFIMGERNPMNVKNVEKAFRQ